MVVLEAIIDFENEDAGNSTYAINDALDAQKALEQGIWNPDVKSLSEIDEEHAANDDELFAVHVIIDERAKKFTFSVYPLFEEPKKRIPLETSYIDEDGAQVQVSGWDNQGYDERAFIQKENKIVEFDIKLHQFKDDWDLYQDCIIKMMGGGIGGVKEIEQSEVLRRQVHETLSNKMSKVLSEKGLHNVGMRHFVAMLREYHANLPRLVQDGTVQLKHSIG
ncbi:MAG: hypothetical protein AAGB32_04370 [Pseudomonadota bacterium]